MFSKKFRVNLRRFHRWFGLVVGIQLSLWVLSGTYFALMSIEKVRGNSDNIKPEFPVLRTSELFPIRDLPLIGKVAPRSIAIESTVRGPIIRVLSAEDETLYFDAYKGLPLEALSPEALPSLLQMQKNGFAITQIKFLEEKVPEFQGNYPVYAVELEGKLQSTVYMDPWTGKVLATRNALWRVFDFLWMLHIMDYKEREDFNNILLRVVSLLSLGILASGYMLFFFGKAPRRERGAG